MAEFSKEDRDIIAQYPLKPALHGLHSSLEAVTSALHPPQQGVSEPISCLVVALQGHAAARNMRSRLSNRNLAAELSTRFARIQSDDFVLNDYLPLIRLVLQDSPDIEIWEAIFDLLKQTQATPPLSNPPIFQDTPITHSSASQRGSEQTRKLIELRIFEEIRSCTYRDVDGFFAKYFEGRPWEQQLNKILQACRIRHVSGRWIGYPDPPEQDAVIGWLFDFQKDFFSNERSLYCTTHDKALPGSEAKRQLDLFVREKAHDAIEAPYHWEDVRVVGELKQGWEANKPLLLQLAAYAREVFASQPTRRFVHGFTLCATMMRLWVFDRSGPYSSTAFNIHHEPERFVRTIVGYTLMDDDELGLDKSIERHDGNQFVTVTDSKSGAEKRLKLNPKPIAHQRAIVCRGTSCYLATAVGFQTPQYVVKFSWRSDKRGAEGDLLRLAQQRGVEGVAEMVAHHDITSIQEMRSFLQFTEPHRFRSNAESSSTFDSNSLSKIALTRSASQRRGLGILQSSSSRKRKAAQAGAGSSKRSRSKTQLSTQIENDNSQASNNSEVSSLYDIEDTHGNSLFERNHEPFDNRILCCLVISPPGRSVHNFQSIRELLEAFRDAIKGHRSLYEQGKILHRDVSENNIIITDGDYKGMLIDLDLAKERGRGPSGARHRTGTMEFMAVEVLEGVSHTYRHDLESFLYVFLWVCINYGWNLPDTTQKKPERSMLKNWYTGSYEDIARLKRGDMDKGGFNRLLAEFPSTFDCVKDLAKKLRDTLFPIRGGALFVGTPQEPSILYAPIILAFDHAANGLERKGT